MHNSNRIVMLGSVLALAACQPPAATDGEAAGATPAEEADPVGKTLATPTPDPTGEASPAEGENDGAPDITPAKLSGDAAKGEKGARNMLLAWARGIELREFDQAWNLMSETAKSQLSRAQFNDRFHSLRDIAVSIPSGTMEGAAGSSYYTAPTTISGVRSDGSKVTLNGEVVLRRVNDVPGATPEQLAWHIEQVNLTPG